LKASAARSRGCLAAIAFPLASAASTALAAEASNGRIDSSFHQATGRGWLRLQGVWPRRRKRRLSPLNSTPRKLSKRWSGGALRLSLTTSRPVVGLQTGIRAAATCIAGYDREGGGRGVFESTRGQLARYLSARGLPDLEGLTQSKSWRVRGLLSLGVSSVFKVKWGRCGT